MNDSRQKTKITTMEDKKLNEQESLELISNMIKQTNNHMANGAGNTFIAWGVILFMVSILADTAIGNTNNGNWMWLYMAIPVIGLPFEWWMKRKAKQKNTGHIKTYIEDSIEKVWKCMGLLLVAYPLILFLHQGADGPRVWIAMFFLGMLLPALGSFITGVLLKSKWIMYISLLACSMSLVYLERIVAPNFVMTLNSTYIFPLCAVFSLIIPGILINHKAKKANK